MAARILIIEDDTPSRELARYLLSRAGYEALGAPDGRSGIQIALEESPELVLCDVQLPVINGYAVAGELRANPNWRRVPLIAVTALSMPGDRERTLEAGFDAYLSKPITPETFVSEVESFLPADQRVVRKPP